MREDYLTERPGWYRWAAIVATSLSFSLAAVAMSYYAVTRERAARHEADLKWCAVIVTLDDAYSEDRPATASGRNLAQAIRDLRYGLPCPPPKGN